MEISIESVLGDVFITAKRSRESYVFCVTLNHQKSAEGFQCWMQHTCLMSWQRSWRYAFLLIKFEQRKTNLTTVLSWSFTPVTISKHSDWLWAGRSGIESRWGRDFPPVQTGPGAHPASYKMGTGSFPGVKCGRGVLLTTHPLLVPRSWKSRAIPLPTLWATPSL